MNAVAIVLFTILSKVTTKLADDKKNEFCETLNCDLSDDKQVCGIRLEDGQTKLRIFDNECELLQYGCQVNDEKAYGIINIEHCHKETLDDFNTNSSKYTKFGEDCNYCIHNNTDPESVCGIRKDGEGFRIRVFENECLLLKYNCEQNLEFQITDKYICNGIDLNRSNETRNETNDYKKLFHYEADGESNNGGEIKEIEVNEVTDVKNMSETENRDYKYKLNNVVVVDGSMVDRNNLNNSIENFFAATHVLDLPLQEMQPHLNETTRRMLLKIFGPITVFKPWVTIPKNISNDYYHRPTLASCYHKCPKKCPDTYAPVCGVPGIVAREPSLMFKNHCFMDVAQCKMHWEDKSDTAISSAYIESSFLFCLGDEMNGLYRFLPLIRTLQHMGRLKKKGVFRYKLKNMRFFNNLLSREPKIMG